VTSYPRQQARTRRFTLGVPRAFVPGVGPDGPTVLFLRTDAGDDPVTHLWRHDPVAGVTTKLVDARALGGDEGELPAAERARRERAREQAGGIVAYAVDDGLTMAAFALAGRLYTVDVGSGAVAHQPTAGPAFDPRPSPDGGSVAYLSADGLHLVDLDHGPGTTGSTRPLAVEDGVAWGRAEFVAAEEMGRARGFWWDADGARLVVARVDESDVPVWTIADPANPWTPPTRHRYPAAGTVNAAVTLWVLDVRSGARTEVVWDREHDEYLAHVGWGADPLTLLVQPRDQRTARILTADPATGETRLVREWTDPAWVELVPGSPTWFQGRLLTVEDRADLGDGGTRAICADGEPVTPPGLQVRELLAAHAWRDGSTGEVVTDRSGVVELLASPTSDPTRVDAWKLNLDPPYDLTVWSRDEDLAPGVRRVVPARRRMGGGPAGGSPSVEVVSTLDRPAPSVTVVWSREDDDVEEQPLEVVAEPPVLTARPRMLELGTRRSRAALLLPSDDDGGRASLPVLLDPYGGPHAQRVLSSQAAHLTSQWLADQGFAVLVVDGRGSPGRGPEWERAIHGDLASAVLEDQIDALHAAAELEPRLDLDRVAIRGWSFGGYLAALAVLRRPDVFHAAVAGAPVTDWRLYDTHYTERYLGHPDQDPGAYDVSSLVDADGQLLGAAPWDPDAPPALLIVHGMADDNVVAAHALRLSSALLADGRPHAFLPLSGVTHMTPQEVVAEQLLVQQVRFLHEALARRPTGRPGNHAGGPGRA
jgi:dipeptidyl-peptidase 4